MNVNEFPLITKRLVLGDVPVCLGGCCGNSKPGVPVEWLMKKWKARGLLKQIQMTISGCLEPCDIPNVAVLSDERGAQWLGDITRFSQYQSLLDWAVSSRNAGELLPLPNEFQRCSVHTFRKPTSDGRLHLFSAGGE